MRKKKAIFLDRDGTINVDSGFVHKWRDWQWTGGAVEALLALYKADYLLVVVTNQSGVGHNLYSPAEVEEVHHRMAQELKRQGVELAAVVFCPHRRDSNCGCRKPATGMIRKAEDSIGPVDYASSWVIGDKQADVGLGRRAGTRTALIRSRYWQEDALEQQPDMIVNSLREAAENIVSNQVGSSR